MKVTIKDNVKDCDSVAAVFHHMKLENVGSSGNKTFSNDDYSLTIVIPDSKFIIIENDDVE